MKTLAAMTATLLFAFIHTGTAAAHVKQNHWKQRHHIANRAIARIGADYCWGGSRGCFDCSGFSRRVFAGHGAKLPHSSTEQWKARHRSGWKTIWARKNLKRGDLVFFKNTYKRGISHLGIYVGNGRFVHASSSGGGVRRSSFRNDYYRKHWHGGVRPAALRR